MTVNVEIAEESICQLLELIRGLAKKNKRISKMAQYKINKRIY